MREYGVIETDHEFDPSPFCDCASCNELCRYHYFEDDACLKERYWHKEKAPTVKAEASYFPLTVR